MSDIENFLSYIKQRFYPRIFLSLFIYTAFSLFGSLLSYMLFSGFTKKGIMLFHPDNSSVRSALACYALPSLTDVLFTVLCAFTVFSFAAGIATSIIRGFRIGCCIAVSKGLISVCTSGLSLYITATLMLAVLSSVAVVYSDAILTLRSFRRDNSNGSTMYYRLTVTEFLTFSLTFGGLVILSGTVSAFLMN